MQKPHWTRACRSHCAVVLQPCPKMPSGSIEAGHQGDDEGHCSRCEVPGSAVMRGFSCAYDGSPN